PAVYRAIAAGMRAFELTGDYPLVAVDVPLLYETGSEKNFDRVIVTLCPPALQIARLLARGLTEQEARRRLAAQWPTDQKAARARCAPRRRCSNRGSAGIARGARCCGSGIACRRAGRGRRPHVRSARRTDRRATPDDGAARARARSPDGC